MINFKVEILKEENGKDNVWIEYPTAIFPFKVARLLDEQLDECNLTIKYIKKPYFKPLSLVRITVENTPDALFSQADFEDFKANMETEVTMTYNSVTKQITEIKEFMMVVANDNAIEVMGLGIDEKVYNHEIYLIELTKILEGFIGESITFTNALGNNYIDS